MTKKSTGIDLDSNLDFNMDLNMDIRKSSSRLSAEEEVVQFNEQTCTGDDSWTSRPMSKIEEQLEEEEQEQNDNELIFDQGYSWVVLIAATTVSTFSWGANSSFGVYLANFITSNKYPDATDLDFAFVGGLSFGIGLMGSPIPTLLIKRFPYQAVIIFGAFIQAGGLVAASFATKTWHLYLSQGVMQGLGISLVFIPANAALPQWFKKRRGIANGVFTAGSGLGGIIFSFTIQALIDSLGIAWAQRIGGLMCFSTCLISGCFIKSRPLTAARKGSNEKTAASAPAKFYDKELLKRLILYLIVIWSTLTMLGYGIVLYTMSAYTVSLGLTHSQGAVVSACVSVGVVVGRPSMGYLIDVWGSINISLLSSFLTALLIFCMWINAHSYGVTIAFGLLVGLVLSGSSTGFPTVCASVVDLELLVPMYTMSWIVIGGFGIFAEPMAISLRINDKYLYTQIFTGLLYFVGGLFLWFARGMQVRKVLNGNVKDEEESPVAVAASYEKGDGDQTVVQPLPAVITAPSFFHCMSYMIKV